MDIDITQKFLSHSDGKLLSTHLRGVSAGVRKRTSLKTAEIAAIFHDLGKINPNFQNKLAGLKTGYSGHAYLSALAWLCFCQANRELVKELFGSNPLAMIEVAAMVARHHGDLPDFAEGIFKERPRQELQTFLKKQGELPISDFLQHLLGHSAFQLIQPDAVLAKIFNLRLIQDCITRPLDFFLNTQFGFACLIEADKRDAGNNYIYNKEIIGEYFKGNFAGHLDERFAQFTPRRTLDALRTEMREEAAQNIRAQLSEGRRVFTLAAPTGAGKTMMLLALANEIRRQNEDLGVVYALPFLSITEQVEQECRKIWHDNADAVLRIDSKAENERVEKLQRELDEDPDKLGEMLRESFAEDTFDHPFIITTFVRLCETLVSNRNATLLKLPNFASTVFLLDEIQALPPRLYLFFVALLDEFCRRFDSYAVISTATMPYLEMPQKDLPPDKDPRRLFLNYQRPGELLEGRDYYQRPEFNRYEIVPCAPFTLSIEELAAAIRAEENSCLVILNTIDETKRLYDLLRPKQDDDFWREERYPPFFDTATNTEFADEVVLLNTHFTLEDRRWKLDYCKHCLDAKRKVVLISTQLIEAGVDIDFPTLYRDLCPLPSLIQSAGRCNRNGDGPTKGRVHLFELLRPDNKSSASLIYQDEPPWYLNFTKERITAPINEAELFALQLDFFLTVGQNLSVGQHQDMNLLECINRAECAKLGKFRLIDEKHFGVEYRYYVPIDEDDYSFADLQDLTEQPRGCDFAEAKRRQLAIASHIRKMASRIVTFRLNPNKPAPAYNGEVLDIRQLAQFPDYSSRKGIRTDASGGCFI